MRWVESFDDEVEGMASDIIFNTRHCIVNSITAFLRRLEMIRAGHGKLFFE